MAGVFETFAKVIHNELLNVALLPRMVFEIL